ncbi:MAG: FAD-binding oxidoreductase, partial [Egibacteraceae bacterium]
MSTVETTLRPATLGEARDMVRDTPGALLFRGGGTKRGWGAPAEHVDAVVETSGLDQLVEHSAGDMVAIVEAGLRLPTLQEALVPSGQWLAVDPPLAHEGATVGGVVATNDHGPRRLRYGSPRDLLIGVTVVLADGSVVQAGGRVVKNVAGFDLMRLLCGSFGTLGLMTHAIVRLHPLPEASLTLAFKGDEVALGRLVLALLASPVEPTAMDVAGGALWLRLEGRDAGIAAQAKAARTLAEVHGARP